MCRGRRCWCLGSLLLLLLGQNLGLHIEIPQDAVSGTVGQSVLLPVSYRVNSSLSFPLANVWKFGNSSQVIIICVVQNCSLDAWGAPKKCSARSYPHIPYRGRIDVFPENASLLLRDLRLSDSGVYSIVFKEQNQSRRITRAKHKQLVVSVHPVFPVPPDEGTAVRIPWYSLGACYCFILLLLQLLFHLLCLRGGHQQQSQPGEA
ncbi:hepatic and glial cell adhesion molecule-like [Excalfactoria chinensis]|uniref:hepatic and glial cell adhesion molecule-like n=1 Tax=Excalfactoria chinensis TaxID=46218 RepID=UPI003B3AE588